MVVHNKMNDIHIPTAKKFALRGNCNFVHSVRCQNLKWCCYIKSIFKIGALKSPEIGLEIKVSRKKVVWVSYCK